MAEKSLKSARRGEIYRIVDVVSGHALSERLLELGLQAGECVRVLHEAPVSADPIVIEVSGTRLAMRRDEAALVLVKDFSSDNQDHRSFEPARGDDL
jgi:Fe2+ transport system protein FeoA